jgi:hypothetical protein
MVTATDLDPRSSAGRIVFREDESGIWWQEKSVRGARQRCAGRHARGHSRSGALREGTMETITQLYSEFERILTEMISERERIGYPSDSRHLLMLSSFGADLHRARFQMQGDGE